MGIVALAIYVLSKVYLWEGEMISPWVYYFKNFVNFIIFVSLLLQISPSSQS